MSDRDEKLWAAIEKALIEHEPFGDEDITVGAILAAVNAVLEDGETVEWGARCTHPEHGHRGDDGGVYQVSAERCDVEQFIHSHGRAQDYALVSRRSWVGQWEAAS